MHQSVESDEQSCQVHEFHNTVVGAGAHGRWSSILTWRFHWGYVERRDRRAVLDGATRSREIFISPTFNCYSSV